MTNHALDPPSGWTNAQVAWRRETVERMSEAPTSHGLGQSGPDFLRWLQPGIRNPLELQGKGL